MADFGSYPSGAPGSAFHEWDAVSKRRYNVSQGGGAAAPAANDYNAVAAAPTPAPVAAPTSSYGGAAPGYDPITDAIKNLSMGQGLHRAAGARLAATNAAPNDPSLAAYGGLMGELGGQSDASNQSQTASLSWAQHLADQAWQEHMMRVQEEMLRKRNQGAWLGDLGQLAGTLGGAYLGGPAMAAAKVAG